MPGLNTLPVIDGIAAAALDIFENNLVALKHCARQTQDEFGNKGAQKGDTFRIRKPAQFTVRSGAAWVGQGIEEQFDTMVLTYQKGVDWSMTSRERKLDLNSMINQVVKPAIVRLANEVDKDILQDATRAIAQTVGTSGTTPTAMSTYLNAGALLTDHDCPRGRGERWAMIGATAEASIVNALALYRNNPSEISREFDTGEMNYAAGMNWEVDQNIYTHTTGTYSGTPVTNGAGVEGATTLVTSGWTSTSLKQGDVFTIGSVFDVNPVTKGTLKNLKQFVVTGDISDSAGAITIPISPPLFGPGSGKQNISALPLTGATITVQGATGAVSPQGVIWNKNAVTVAIVPLDEPGGVNTARMKYDEQSGVGIRYIEWYDGDSDLWKSRTDVVYGILCQRPEWGVRVAS